MHVARELDAGDVICSQVIRIAADETGGGLHDRLADLAPEVLAETLKRLATGTATCTPQDARLVTCAPNLEREQGRLVDPRRAALSARMSLGLLCLSFICTVWKNEYIKVYLLRFARF